MKNAENLESSWDFRLMILEDGTEILQGPNGEEEVPLLSICSRFTRALWNASTQWKGVPKEGRPPRAEFLRPLIDSINSDEKPVELPSEIQIDFMGDIETEIRSLVVGVKAWLQVKPPETPQSAFVAASLAWGHRLSEADKLDPLSDDLAEYEIDMHYGLAEGILRRRLQEIRSEPVAIGAVVTDQHSAAGLLPLAWCELRWCLQHNQRAKVCAECRGVFPVGSQLTKITCDDPACRKAHLRTKKGGVEAWREYERARKAKQRAAKRARERSGETCPSRKKSV
ncbi:MAG: hypothetical protein ACM3X4_01240 [Ignavibacteriales bacterium]